MYNGSCYANCPDGTFEDKDNNACSDTCPAHNFENFAMKSCDPCNYWCYNCFGADQDECTECWVDDGDVMYGT